MPGAEHRGNFTTRRRLCGLQVRCCLRPLLPALPSITAPGPSSPPAKRATSAPVDVAMPKRSGLDATRALPTECPGRAVVLVTGRDDQAVVLEGMALGVRGFVVKSVAPEEFVDAIRAAAPGGTYLSPV